MSEYNFSLSRIFSYKDRIEEFSRISRSKGNRTMKLGLGQLIKCNMRNIFREKSLTKCDGETISRSSSKKSKMSISLAQ